MAIVTASATPPAAVAGDKAGKHLAVVSGGATTTGKPAPARPKMSHDEVKDTIGRAIIDPKEVANKKAEAARDKKLKDDAMDAKLADQRHKELQAAQDQGDQAAGLFKDVITLRQDLVRLQFDYKKAAPDESEKVKAKALATYVRLCETIAQLMEPIKSSKSSASGTMKSVWEFDMPFLTALIKERKLPKLQFELELGTTRSALDTAHKLCESNGAPRVQSNEKKATGKDAAGNQGNDD